MWWWNMEENKSKVQWNCLHFISLIKSLLTEKPNKEVISDMKHDEPDVKKINVLMEMHLLLQ